MIQISNKNSKPFCSIRSESVTKIPPPFPPFSKTKGLRDIGHNMSTRKLILGVNSVTVSHLIHYGSLLQMRQILLQNAIAIVTKYDRNLLQNASGFLLQNATVL